VSLQTRNTLSSISCQVMGPRLQRV
jgi:hypothetical protein